MLPSISDLAKRRKSIGLKQKELAKMADVSQSMIAKLEAGKINPSYDNVKKIIDVLEKKENENQITAKEIMQKKVISVKPDSKISNAIVLMKRYGISQMPILENGTAVGSVSDRTILELISDEGNMLDVSDMEISEIMDDSFPLVPEDTSISTLKILLKDNLSILVTNHGKIVGIVSKADMLNARSMMYK